MNLKMDTLSKTVNNPNNNSNNPNPNPTDPKMPETKMLENMTVDEKLNMLIAGMQKL